MEVKCISTDRILTIQSIEKDERKDYYVMKGSGHRWSEDMIECLAEDYKEPEPIKNRFDLLDID